MIWVSWNRIDIDVNQTAKRDTEQEASLEWFLEIFWELNDSTNNLRGGLPEIIAKDNRNGQ